MQKPSKLRADSSDTITRLTNEAKRSQREYEFQLQKAKSDVLHDVEKLQVQWTKEFRKKNRDGELTREEVRPVDAGG